MLNSISLPALPPSVPLVADTVHVAGWTLLVALVALPALTLVANALREAAARARRPEGPRAPVRLCSAHG